MTSLGIEYEPIRASVGRLHCVNNVCMKGLQADASDVDWVLMKSRAAFGSPHQYRCRSVLELMGSHRNRIQCHLRHPENSTLFHLPMWMRAWFCLGESWYRRMLLIAWLQAPYILHNSKGNSQLKRNHSIADTVRLFHINDLVTFGTACLLYSTPYGQYGFRIWVDNEQRRANDTVMQKQHMLHICLVRYIIVSWGHAVLQDSGTHYNDVIMSPIASQITSLTIVYSTIYSDADQRKYQSSASLAFVRGIHRWPVNSPHKGSETRKMFPFDEVIMTKLPVSSFTNNIHLEFHGTAPVSEIGAPQVPWNSMEFHGTARVSEIGAFLVPWNSMELLVSAKLAHLKFHGTVRVSEIGALLVPWNSVEFHGTARVSEIGARQLEFHGIPWNSMKLVVSAKLAHPKFHGIPWTSHISEIGALEVPWNSMELLVSAKLAHS